MATRIDESRSPANITVVRGDTAMLVCTVINIGDKSVNVMRYENIQNFTSLDAALYRFGYRTAG